jgi:hypothetical protein
MRGLRSRATCARRAIRQVVKRWQSSTRGRRKWSQLETETASLVASIRRARHSEELALVVKGLESRRLQAEDWLRELSNTQEINPGGLFPNPTLYH